MSMDKTFLVVGKSFNSLEAEIARRGNSFIVFDADFSDKAKVDHALDNLPRKIDAVFCIYEQYILPTAYIAHRLKLPGMPLQAAERCTDKFLMRQAFAAVPENISANFALLENEETLLSFAKKHGYPLIIKPANLTKSLLVTKNHNQPELLENYRRTLANIEKVYKRYAPDRQPKLLVEEFLEGPAYSVDAFVNAQGTPYVLDKIVDYQTGYDIGYDDNFHYSRLLPSKLSPDRQKALRHTAELGIKALGMHSSPAHVEIIYTKKGPRIIEIGARNGGYRGRMHQLANGLNIYDVALNLALGKNPDITATKNDPCAVLELFPKKPGVFVGVANQTELEGLPSLVSIKLKQKIGSHVGKSSEGYKMCAIIILHNPDPIQFNKDLEFVNSKVHVQTQP
jgi:biotin carboxylase